MILTAFTAENGLCSGWFRPGKKDRSFSQQGALLQLKWRARLRQNLGSFQTEFMMNPLLPFLNDPLRLGAGASFCDLLALLLPEGHPYPQLWDALIRFFKRISTTNWLIHYIRLELVLLKEMGFGLSLDKCAVSGVTTGLTHVSPRTGRAVCFDVAAPYTDKLLFLPSFLTGGSDAQQKDHYPCEELLQGLALTGYFLQYACARQCEKGLPEGRARFIRFVEKWHEKT